MLTVLDLFSGIGGFSLGLERTGGFRTIAFAEIEPYCCRILQKHWPEIPNLGDITNVESFPAADIITAGFPCQDISDAGARAGLSGARSGLFGEVVRAVRMVRPRRVVLENVADLLDRGMGEVCGAFSEIGYGVEWDCIPASAVGAPHIRDRVFITAHADLQHGPAGLGILAVGEEQISAARRRNSAEIWLEAAGRLARMDDGFSDFLDRRKRTEAIGNSVLPQIAELIGTAILTRQAEAVT